MTGFSVGIAWNVNVELKSSRDITVFISVFLLNLGDGAAG